MVLTNTILAALALTSASTAASISQIPLVSVSTVTEIPLLGFGTWNLANDNTSVVVATALETGFRHIDCAKAYGNQHEVGKGLKQGLINAGLKREDIWVTSKLWNDAHGVTQVPIALQQTLDELDLEYLDLYLMHWPVASNDGKNTIDFIETWRAMTLLLATGKVKHIGVCNFSPSQLNELLDSVAGRLSRPYAHQFETHPYLPQVDWLSWHQTHGIHVTAYSPLANSNPTYNQSSYSAMIDDVVPLLRNPVLKDIAQKRSCSIAQVALKWGLLRKTSIIPKSAHADRIVEDFEATECHLETEDIVRMSKELPEKRFSNPSQRWGVPLFDGLTGTSLASTLKSTASSMLRKFWTA